jgi:hypothetical protein
MADPADPTMPPAPPRTERDKLIQGALAKRLPHYGSPELRPVQFAETYARLLALSVARLEFLGELLAEEYERLSDARTSDHPDFAEGDDYDPGDRGAMGALVGATYGIAKDGYTLAIGENIRALVKLEAEERDRAARLAKDGIRIGIEAKQVDVMRSYGRTVVASLRALCEELGVSWEEEGTRRAAQRAILTARTGLNQQVFTADRAGPPVPIERGHDVPG